MMLCIESQNSYAEQVTSGSPQLFVPETKFEFGEVHEGEAVRHQFILKNKGSSALTIKDVKTD
jgi:hypothetical protein